jgi:hypothetical protein
MWRCRNDAVLLALVLAFHAECAAAYTAAGDRIFPATVLLPQIGPSDEFYVTGSTLPQTAAGPDGRDSTVSITFDKTITDRLSLTMTGAYSVIDEGGGDTAYGWQNFDASLQYLAVVDPERELLFSAGVDQNFGGTGAGRVGASAQGTTTPSVYFGKGLGDFDIGLLRPLAIAGFVGYGIADRGPQPDAFTSGMVVEYSFPYLDSKVSMLALPDFMHAVTLLCEVAFSDPVNGHQGAAPTVTVAPGFNYAGQGWDFGVEALVPANHATGSGLGVIAQLHLSLDYLAPDGIGKPLF